MAKIMIIDDDTELMNNSSALLESKGYTTVTMDTTEGAVDAVVQNAPDLLVLDVMFPGNPSAGFELARSIRQREEIKSLPIILLTNVNQEIPMDFSTKDIDDEWMPVQDFLEKPLKIDQLKQKIEEILNK